MTGLDYLLLGLLFRRPQTGYALGKAITELPVASFSGSPGAVYPALKRLVRKGLIQGQAGERGARGGNTTEYRPTKEGAQAFRDWVTSPIEASELVTSPDLVLIRYSFFLAVDQPASMVRHLGQLQQRVEAVRGQLAAFRVAAERDMADGSRMAMDLLDELMAAYGRWAQRVRPQVEAPVVETPSAEGRGGGGVR